MTSFHGCTALITGASSGIGREIAHQLAPQAAALILVARRLDRLEELRRTLARPGLEIHCHAVDVADDTQIETLLDLINGSGLQVDFLVNNAGLGDHGFFEESDWKRVQAMIDVNISALTRLTHAILPQLIRS
ncbi:MAG: SDR family NAD(P)-dependent oxidoreductase, partial [Chthoniobacteraceae bacterium]